VTWAHIAALGGVAVCILAPLLTRVRIPSIVALGVSALGALAGLSGAVGLVLRGGPHSMAIVGAVPFVGFLIFWFGHRKYPVMNDITTDLEDPPAFVAAADLGPNQRKNLEFRTRNVAMQREHYPQVKPFRTKAVPDAVFKVAKEAGRDFDWHLHAVDDEARTYEAVSITGQFRFRDDVAVRVRVDGEVTVLDVRAKARDGRADFGMNARRIQDLLAAVRVRLPAELEVD